MYENVATSKVITEEIKNKLEPKSYRKLTNDEAMESAIYKLNNNPNEESNWWSKKESETNAMDIAEWLALLAKYQAEGKNEIAVNAIEKNLIYY